MVDATASPAPPEPEDQHGHPGQLRDGVDLHQIGQQPARGGHDQAQQQPRLRAGTDPGQLPRRRQMSQAEMGGTRKAWAKVSDRYQMPTMPTTVSARRPAAGGQATTGGQKRQASIDGLRHSRGRHHRPRHGHGLQHLVLHAARQPQRRHHHSGVLQVGRTSGTVPVTQHAASEASACTAGSGCGRRCTTQPRPARAQPGRTSADEPGHRIDVGPVVHGPGEHERQSRRRRRG
jgi:hypothetical protein